LFVVSFDRDNPYLMLKTGREIALQLQEKIIENAPYCFVSMDTDPLLSQYDMDVYISAVYVKASEDSFTVYYDYDMEIDEINETHSLMQTVEVPLFRILDEANQITDEFLRSYDSPDLVYNLQACNSFYDKYEIKPEYPVDILRNVSTNKDVLGVIVQNDFFIVNMEVDGERFSFAIKPVLVGSIC
jgi:hypothetical protein